MYVPIVGNNQKKIFHLFLLCPKVRTFWNELKVWLYTYANIELDLMFMKHYAPNGCLYIKVAKLRTGVGSAKT